MNRAWSPILLVVLNGENVLFPVSQQASTPDNLVSRDRVGSPVPLSNPSIFHVQAESSACSPVPLFPPVFRDDVHLLYTAENLGSRDRFGSPVPRSNPLILHVQAESGACPPAPHRCPYIVPSIAISRNCITMVFTTESSPAQGR